MNGRRKIKPSGTKIEFAEHMCVEVCLEAACWSGIDNMYVGDRVCRSDMYVGTCHEATVVGHVYVESCLEAAYWSGIGNVCVGVSHTRWQWSL